MSDAVVKPTSKVVTLPVGASASRVANEPAGDGSITKSFRQNVYDDTADSIKSSVDQIAISIWRAVDQAVGGGSNSPPRYPGGAGGGGGGMSDLNTRVALLEEKVKALPGQWFLVSTAATIIVAVVGAVWAIVGDFKIEVRDQFGRIDKRFEQIDSRFERLDTKLESLDGRLRNVESDTKVINSRLDELQKGVNAIEAATTGKH